MSNLQVLEDYAQELGVEELWVVIVRMIRTDGVWVSHTQPPLKHLLFFRMHKALAFKRKVDAARTAGYRGVWAPSLKLAMDYDFNFTEGHTNIWGLRTEIDSIRVAY